MAKNKLVPKNKAMKQVQSQSIQGAGFLWVPQTLTEAQGSVAPPPLGPRGEEQHTRLLTGRGWGDPIPTKEQTLCFSRYKRKKNEIIRGGGGDPIPTKERTLCFSRYKRKN
jgi:hypothetical protein